MRRLTWGMAASLPVLLVVPPPITLRLFAGANPIHAWPLLWLLVAGTVAFAVLVAQRSWPLGMLFAWGAATTLIGGLPTRGVLLLAEIVVVLSGYLVLAALPAEADRWLRGGLALAAGIAAVAGLEDVLGANFVTSGLISLVGAIVTPFGWTTLPSDPTTLGLVMYERDAIQQGHRWVPSFIAGRAQGLLGHPNYLGVFLALALPACWTALPWRWARWVAAGGLVTVIALSRTRTAVLAIVCLAVAAWGPGLLRRARRAPRAGVIVMAAGIVAVMTATIVGRGGVPLWPPSLSGVTFSGRLGGWRLGLETALGAPWIGWGLGQWSRWAQWDHGPIAEQIGTSSGWWETAFSEPLQVFFELGAVGLLLGALALGQAVWDAVRHRHLPGGQIWGGILLVGVLAMWTTSVFHVPVLAVPILMAAARLRARSA